MSSNSSTPSRSSQDSSTRPTLPHLRDVFPEESFGHGGAVSQPYPASNRQYAPPSSQVYSAQHPQHGYRPAQAPASYPSSQRASAAYAARGGTPAPVLYQVMAVGNNGLQALESATDRPIGIYRQTDKDQTDTSSRPKTHICQECGFAFDRPSALQTHVRTHTGERPYQCSACGKDFSTTTNLFRHMRSLHPHIPLDVGHGRAATPGRR